MNDELKALESMGLVLPSAWYIFGTIVFGIVDRIAPAGKKVGKTG